MSEPNAAIYGEVILRDAGGGVLKHYRGIIRHDSETGTEAEDGLTFTIAFLPVRPATRTQKPATGQSEGE